MKKFQFLFFTLILSYGMEVMAQCNVNAGDDMTIVCGDSVQINTTTTHEWVALNSGTTASLRSVFFTDEATGYVVSINGLILKTTNGGNNWLQSTSRTYPGLNSIYFPNATNGYIVGSGAKFIKTADGGSNWICDTLDLVPENTSFTSVYFTDIYTGYIVGSSGTILKTTNGGNSWIKQASGSTESLNSVFFIDSTTGYIAGNGGTFLKTTDGGNNWQKIQIDYPGSLRSIHFPSSKIGYVVKGTNILKTTDGGITWNEQGSPPLFSSSSIFFTSENTGYAIYNVSGNSASIIWKTDNGGIDWIEDRLFLNINFYSIFFFNNTGYVVGNNGAIFKLDQSGSYSWVPEIELNSSNIANPVVSPQQTTNYVVTYTLSNGAYAKDSMTIFVNPLTANAGEDKTITCGGSVQLDNVTTNYTGNGILKYKWTPETGLDNDTIQNPTATVTSDIVYTVTVTTPNGCTATDEVKVNVNPLTANAGNDKTIICGGSVQLDNVTTNYTGNGTLKYKWTPETGLNNDSIANPIVTASIDITYTVTVTTPNGCTATDDVKVFVNPLTVNAGYDKSVVCGGSVQLNGVTTNYTGNGTLKYKWTPETGLDNDSIANPTAMVTSDITYTLTVTTPNGCTATDEVKVNVNPLTANAGNDKTIICGGSVQLDNVTTNYTGNGTLKYKWTPETGLNNDSIANPIVTASIDITYTVTVTTPNGCTATDDVKVIIIPMDKPGIGIVSVNNDNKNLIAWNKIISTGIDSYYIYRETNVTNIYEKIGEVPYDSMSIFIDNQSLPDVQAHKYKLSIFDHYGLESPQSDFHKTMHLAINKGMGTTWNLIWQAYEGFIVSTYNIYRGTTASNFTLLGSVSGENTQYNDINAPEGNIYYQLEVISHNNVNPTKAPVSMQKSKANENGSSVLLTSYNSSRSNIATNVVSGFQDKEDNNKINIYPNPVKNELIINFDGGSTFEILNLTGQVVYNGNLIKNTIVQTSNLVSGVYLIKFKSGNSFEYRKIIKE